MSDTTLETATHADHKAVERKLAVAYSPRHKTPDTKLGADAPDLRELFEAVAYVPAWIRQAGRGR